MSTDTLGSRIARRLTTIAFLTCLYGGWVWLGRWRTEIGSRYWLASYAVAAVAMLGLRAYLGGVRLDDVGRVAGRARAGLERVPRPWAPSRRVVAVVALAVMLALSTISPWLAPVLGPAAPAATAAAASSSSFDFDGDGDLDIVYRSDGNTFAWSDAGGNETDTGVSINGVGGIADLDGDGDLDAAYRDGNNYLHYRDAANNSVNLSVKTHGIGGIADWDGDGDLDILYRDTSKVLHYIDTSGNDVSTGQTAAAVGGIGDADGDGDLDVAIRNSADYLILYDTAGNTANLSTQTSLIGGMGDIDGDGDLDVAYKELSTSDLQYVDASGTVTDTTYQASQAGGVTDIDGDGDQDIAHADGSYNLEYVDGAGNNVSTGVGAYVVGLFSKSLGGSSSGQTVSGVVKNQDGQPCVNCTVVGWGVDYSNISASKAQSLEDRAHELLQEAQNVRPDSYKPDLQLTGANGKLSNTSEPYAAVHTAADWSLRGIDPGGGYTPTLGADPTLGDPLVRAPANERIILTAWDPTKEALLENNVDGDLPGRTPSESKTIIVEQIGPANSTIDEPLRLETKPYVKIRSLSNPGAKKHYAAAVELPTGFYRVKVENSSFSYVIAVGDTKAMVQAIQADLNASAKQLSNRAQSIRDKMDKGKLVKVRTTTNATGHFNFSVGTNVKTVGIQAFKTPPGMATTPENASLESIRTFYATTDYNGSVVLPAEVKTADAPSSNNTVRVREYSAPSYPDLGKFKNATEWFRNWLQNQSYSELASTHQQYAENITRQQWKSTYQSLRSLVEASPAVEDRAQELLGGDQELYIDSAQATTDELRQRVTVMRQAFYETANTVAAGQTSTSTTSNTVSARFPFDTNLKPSDVMVTVHWPNGTSQVLNTSSQYVSIENNVGNDEVVIEDFPTNSSDPGAVSFAVKVANQDGIGTARKTLDNPAKSGSPPSIAGLSLSTLHPGPDETVSFKVQGGEETTVTNITSATVYAPDGTKLATTITGANSIEFQTSGQGIHYVEVTFETASGGTATITQRITAGDVPRKMPPGVRVAESPLGVYAVTGDGIEAGSVEVSNGGSSVTVLAQLNKSADVPGKLHVYTGELSLPPESTVTVRVVKGEEQQAVSQHVLVAVHMARLDTEVATIYANGDPLPRNGENANGEVTTNASGTTIQTLTDANGVLDLSADASPGRVERFVYRFELETGINLPGMVWFPSLPTGGGGWLPAAPPALLLVALPFAARRSSR